MPHFFFQENIVGELNEERQRAEIASMVQLPVGSVRATGVRRGSAGRRRRGRNCSRPIGCTGCHLLDAEATRDDYFPQINRLHGPNLIGRPAASCRAGWLFAWLKDPKQYNPDTRMPSLRLTDREAADITAYLMAQRKPSYEDLEIPRSTRGRATSWCCATCSTPRRSSRARRRSTT